MNQRDVNAMSFDRVTLVMGQRAGKSMAPVNPEASVIAVKAAGSESPTVLDIVRQICSGVTPARKATTSAGSVEEYVRAHASTRAVKATYRPSKQELERAVKAVVDKVLRELRKGSK
jgi:hypothetical protein